MRHPAAFTLKSAVGRLAILRAANAHVFPEQDTSSLLFELITTSWCLLIALDPMIREAGRQGSKLQNELHVNTSQQPCILSSGNSTSSGNPVVLVHGYKDTAAKLRKMACYLNQLGNQTHLVTLIPSWGEVGIDVLATQLCEFIEASVGNDRRLNLVGFSMGGLVARYYVQRLGGIKRVERLITIASPHRGTWMAHLRRNPGCSQMLPGSNFLRELNADAAMLNQLQFTSIWTPLDLMIIPAWSSRLGVGRELRMLIPAHPLMVWQRCCLKIVAELLKG
jgi:triacylglycerol lipase